MSVDIFCKKCMKVSEADMDKVGTNRKKIFCGDCGKFIKDWYLEKPLSTGLPSMTLIYYKKLCKNGENGFDIDEREVIDTPKKYNIKTAQRQAKLMYDKWGTDILEQYIEYDPKFVLGD